MQRSGQEYQALNASMERGPSWLFGDASRRAAESGPHPVALYLPGTVSQNVVERKGRNAG